MLFRSLSISKVSVICRPIFDTMKSNDPSLTWVGIFGSVSRGTHTNKSDVDLLFGYSEGTDVYEAHPSMCSMREALEEALGREVDLLCFVEDGYMRYGELMGLMTGKIIWGNTAFYERTKKKAEEQLWEAHRRAMDAKIIATRIRIQLASSVTKVGNLSDYLSSSMLNG